MNIYTILSKPYKPIFKKFFIKTLDKYEPQASVYIKEFDSKNSKKIQESKLETCIDACEENSDDYFIWSDVDVLFFKPFIQWCLTELGDHDIVFLEHKKKIDLGFFIARSTTNTSNFFSSLLEGSTLENCLKNISYKIFNDDICKYLYHAKEAKTINAKLESILDKQNNKHNIKILSALYGRFNNFDLIEDMKNIENYAGDDDKFLYLLDNKYSTIQVLRCEELLDDEDDEV